MDRKGDTLGARRNISADVMDEITIIFLDVLEKMPPAFFSVSFLSHYISPFYFFVCFLPQCRGFLPFYLRYMTI